MAHANFPCIIIGRFNVLGRGNWSVFDHLALHPLNLAYPGLLNKEHGIRLRKFGRLEEIETTIVYNPPSMFVNILEQGNL
jgi:hypothetical protein